MEHKNWIKKKLRTNKNIKKYKKKNETINKNRMMIEIGNKEKLEKKFRNFTHFIQSMETEQKKNVN